MTKFYRGKERGPEKPLTSYSVPLAFKRIHFYLDVLEAHFAQLGVMLSAKQAESEKNTRAENAHPNPTSPDREAQ